MRKDVGKLLQLKDKIYSMNVYTLNLQPPLKWNVSASVLVFAEEERKNKSFEKDVHSVFDLLSFWQQTDSHWLDFVPLFGLNVAECSSFQLIL